ncbi:MAG TPA: hypothetical protein VH350_04200 [Candidatus Sulfotelmatobacter sp.]|nr:hypothetical protein [Candidatus Sulfotelmatobacter sp.]
MVPGWIKSLGTTRGFCHPAAFVILQLLSFRGFCHSAAFVIPSNARNLLLAGGGNKQIPRRGSSE